MSAVDVHVVVTMSVKLCVLIYLCFMRPQLFVFFFFNDTATTEIYTLSLHDALPISRRSWWRSPERVLLAATTAMIATTPLDRKSTRLNSSHSQISYAVFCLKKKKINARPIPLRIRTYLRDTSESRRSNPSSRR